MAASFWDDYVQEILDAFVCAIRKTQADTQARKNANHAPQANNAKSETSPSFHWGKASTADEACVVFIRKDSDLLGFLMEWQHHPDSRGVQVMAALQASLSSHYELYQELAK